VPAASLSKGHFAPFLALLSSRGGSKRCSGNQTIGIVRLYLRITTTLRGVLQSLEGSLGYFFSCPALALSVALWPIRPVAELLQLETEDPFAADASRRPYAKTPRTPAFGMVDLVVPLRGVQVGGGCLSLLHILY
jgi:hypothetical protein